MLASIGYAVACTGVGLALLALGYWATIIQRGAAVTDKPPHLVCLESIAIAVVWTFQVLYDMCLFLSKGFNPQGLVYMQLTVSACMLGIISTVFLIYGLVFGPTDKTILAWFGVLAIQLACAAYAFVLDKEKLTPLLSLPLQQILYRQLMYVVLLQSWITALTGGRLRWQKLRRKGGVSAPPGASAQQSQALDGRPVA